jgi:hypothetical protein
MANNFCILPFISIESSTTGRPMACCNNVEIIKNNGRQLNFKKDSLEDAFYSDTMNSLRKDFLENKRPDSCSACWDIENAGGKSKRLINNEKFKWFVAKADHFNPKFKYLHLKLGNICNLKCII